MRKNLLKRTVISLRTVLAVGAAIQLAMLPAVFGQADTTTPKELKPVVVTGSLIPTAETVGVAPMEPISTEAIQKSASGDVLQVLKKLSTSFAGSGNYGQTVNNSSTGGGEAYVALRNLPTLVLLDGHRLASSTFSLGSSVDLNTIPLAMIERIEVLKDGASALYGADAIGGVINIITKKNFNGAEVGGRYGFATGKGQYAEESAYVIGGTSTEKTSVTMGASWYRSDPLRTRDREPANFTNEQLFDHGVTDGNGSSRYPGNIGGQYILAGDGQYLQNNPAYGYVPGLTTPPVFSGQTFSSVADYNSYAMEHGYPNPQNPSQTIYNAPYLDLYDTPAANSPPIAKSPFGCLFYFPAYTYSIQEQNRETAFANFNHELFGKKMELYASFLYAHTKSVAQMAPSPVGNLFADGKIGVPANNPYNPFGTPFGLGGLTDPANPAYNSANTELNVRTRFIDFGPRIFIAQKDNFNFVGGLKGDISDKYSYDVKFNYNLSDEQLVTKNAVNSYALNQALTPNLAVDPSGMTSILRDYAGNAYAPTYNIFAMGGVGANAQSTVDAVRATLYQYGISELYNVGGVVNGTPFDLPAGPVGIALGGSYDNESMSIDFDGLTKQGQVPGLNPAFPTPRSIREREAGFIEVRLPIFSEQKHIPGFYSFEINASGRYENLSPGGSSAVPKVGFRWQPFDNQLTLRGTYSQGFVAPSMYELFGAPLVSNPNLRLANGVMQEQVMYVANPSLPAAESENFSLGFVYSPKQVKGLTVSADYYRISVDGQVYNPDPNAMAASLDAASAAGNPQSSPWYNFYTKPNGERLQPYDTILHGSFGNLTVPNLPGAATKTEGIDLSANYELPTDSAGKFSFFVNANVLLKYDYSAGPGEPFYSYAGQFTDANWIGQGQGTLPDFQITPGVSWDYRNFTATILARYIPALDDPGDNHPYEGGTLSGTDNWATIDPGTGTVPWKTWKVGDWYSIDVQLAYQFTSPGKWYDSTRLAIGCNNLTDNGAPLIASSTEDHTDKSTYDIIGRLVYFEVSKKF